VGVGCFERRFVMQNPAPHPLHVSTLSHSSESVWTRFLPASALALAVDRTFYPPPLPSPHHPRECTLLAHADCARRPCSRSPDNRCHTASGHERQQRQPLPHPAADSAEPEPRPRTAHRWQARCGAAVRCRSVGTRSRHSAGRDSDGRCHSARERGRHARGWRGPTRPGGNHVPTAGGGSSWYSHDRCPRAAC